MVGKESRQIQSVKHLFRNFLRINNSREFLLFLFFLFISFGVWYLTTLTNEYEMKYTPTLKLKNLPKELRVATPLPEKIDIVLKDKGDKLIEYKARGTFKELTIDYRLYPNAMGRTAIYGAELNKLIAAHLASSTQIVSLSHDTLSCHVASAQGKRIPVKVTGHIEANNQYQIDRIRVIPDSITVYTAPALMDSLKAVNLPQVHYTNLTDSVSQELTLVPSSPSTIYEPHEVELRVAVSPYVTKSIDIPINAHLFPYGVSLKTFPSKARVTFRISLEDYNKVTEKDFELRVHYAQIKDNPTGKITLKLEASPSNISNIKIEPNEVDYLLEMNALPLLP